MEAAVRRRDWVGDAAGAAAFVAAICAVAFIATGLKPDAVPLSHTVKVVVAAGGHGSGVHIGNGIVLSAAHVAGEGEKITIQTSDGEARDAAVYWSSASFDLALIQTTSDNLPTVNLTCTDPLPGDAVIAEGNPQSLEFVSARGYVVGGARKSDIWESVIPLDMTIVPGMSGGPLIDMRGNLVGITVAVMTTRLGLTPSLTGFGYAVPPSAICALLGRS
jgi:S1-C subfamily serine protease